MMKKIFLLFALSLLMACGNSEKKEQADASSNEATNNEQKTTKSEDYSSLEDLQNNSGNYKIVELKGHDLSADKILLEFDGKAEKLSGNLGCNDFVAAFKIEDDEVVRFNDPVSTEMVCEGNMENEKSLAEVLPQITHARIDNKELVFLSEDNKVLLSLKKEEESE